MSFLLLNLITELSDTASSMGRQVRIMYGGEQTPRGITPNMGEAQTLSQDLYSFDDSDVTEME